MSLSIRTKPSKRWVCLHVKDFVSRTIYILKPFVSRMALIVKTKSGSTYSYLRKSNEIVEGAVREKITPIVFKRQELTESFPNLSVFTIAITHKCNLRCSYCCYSGEYRNTRQHGYKSISSSDIDSVLGFIESYKSNSLPLTISFYGGECLLELELIKDFVSKSKKKWSGNVQFEISTNGTLLKREIIQWLVENSIVLFVSLDGTVNIQDRQRTTSNGEGTFNIVKNALAYINANYPDFFNEKVHIMMTVTDVTELSSISKDWNEDSLLRYKLPLRISTVYPNYSKGVNQYNEDECVKIYLDLLDYYEAHQEYALLKVFFERFLAEWNARPIHDIDESIVCPTCVPFNSKLYIDIDGQVGLCEKIPDIYRFGNISDGINWDEVESLKENLESVIISRCSSCPVTRLCDICPIDIDFSEEEMNIFCHNQRIIQKVKFRLLCEMAERGLL